MRQTYALKLFLAAIQTARNRRLTASYRELSDMLCITQRSVIKMVDRLEKRGLLTVLRIPNQPNTYFINEENISLGETL